MGRGVRGGGNMVVVGIGWGDLELGSLDDALCFVGIDDRLWYRPLIRLSCVGRLRLLSRKIDEGRCTMR